MTRSRNKFNIIWIIIILLLISAVGVVLYKKDNKYRNFSHLDVKNNTKNRSEHDFKRFTKYGADSKVTDSKGKGEDISTFNDEIPESNIDGRNNSRRESVAKDKYNNKSNIDNKFPNTHNTIKDEPIEQHKDNKDNKDTIKNSENNTSQTYVVKTSSSSSSSSSPTSSQSYFIPGKTGIEDTGENGREEMGEAETKESTYTNPKYNVKIFSDGVKFPIGSVIIARASGSGNLLSSAVIKEHKDGYNIMPFMHISLDDPRTPECDGLMDSEKVEFYLKDEESGEEQLLVSNLEIDKTYKTGFLDRYKIELEK